MILVRFWHGPTWGYVIFGFIHGVAVLINYFWKQFVNINLNKYFSWFLTFTIVNFAFIFFKSPNLNIASNMMIGLSNIFEMTNTNNLNSIQSNFSKTTILFFIIATIIIFFTKNTQSIVEKFKPNIFYIFILAFLFSTCLLRLRGLEFIYFAF
jgi:alginate O-acetyltransferase complex protein AlgI